MKKRYRRSWTVVVVVVVMVVVVGMVVVVVVVVGVVGVVEWIKVESGLEGGGPWEGLRRDAVFCPGLAEDTGEAKEGVGAWQSLFQFSWMSCGGCAGVALQVAVVVVAFFSLLLLLALLMGRW